MNPADRAPVVFLLDVDNTLLDNDRVTADLRRYLSGEVGSERNERLSAQEPQFFGLLRESLAIDPYQPRARAMLNLLLLLLARRDELHPELALSAIPPARHRGREDLGDSPVAGVGNSPVPVVAEHDLGRFVDAHANPLEARIQGLHHRCCPWPTRSIQVAIADRRQARLKHVREQIELLTVGRLDKTLRSRAGGRVVPEERRREGRDGCPWPLGQVMEVVDHG
jgi:hypothetical protein